MEHFYDEAERTKTEKLFHLILKLIRRTETAALTLQNVRRLSVPKQRAMLLKAYTTLNTKEWTMFAKKTKELFDPRVKIMDFPLKGPMAGRPCVRAAITRAINKSL